VLFLSRCIHPLDKVEYVLDKCCWELNMGRPVCLADNRLSPRVFDQLAERPDEVEVAWRETDSRKTCMRTSPTA
jgi:hypothetical protein